MLCLPQVCEQHNDLKLWEDTSAPLFVPSRGWNIPLFQGGTGNCSLEAGHTLTLQHLRFVDLSNYGPTQVVATSTCPNQV